MALTANSFKKYSYTLPIKSFSSPNSTWLILVTWSTTFFISFADKFLVINVPCMKHPLKSSNLFDSVCNALSSVSFNLFAGVFIIVNHLASSGRLYVPSLNIDMLFSISLTPLSFKSNPSCFNDSHSFSYAISYFSPMNLRKINVSIMSLFSKNDPEFLALLNISRQLKRILSKLKIFLSSFFAIFTSCKYDLIILNMFTMIPFITRKINVYSFQYKLQITFCH